MNIRNVVEEIDPNMVAMDTSMFVKDYNSSIPEAFPRVSVKILQVFQTAHPSLFKRKDQWTVFHHRKKVMDWLASYSKRT